nr:hypothetical protein CFP56_36365 [Quercus suber]
MWKSKRNVRIQYKALPPSKSSIPADNTDRVDDTVTYQSLDGEKVSTIHGVDSCAGSGETRGEWDWRGKGWLKMASSHWEILGWGVEEGSGNKWVVTIFAKTIFTPAGIDVYSRDASGLSKVTVQKIKEGLAQVEDENVKQMALQLFELTIDGARKD